MTDQKKQAPAAEPDENTEIATSTVMLIAKISALLKMPPNDLFDGGAIWDNGSEEPMIIVNWDQEGVKAVINHHLPPMINYALKGVSAEHGIEWDDFCPHGHDDDDDDDDDDDEDDEMDIEAAVAVAGDSTKH
jgi:hypothetical protein